MFDPLLIVLNQLGADFQVKSALRKSGDIGKDVHGKQEDERKTC